MSGEGVCARVPVPEDNVWSKMGGHSRPFIHSLSYGTGYQRKELSPEDNSLTWQKLGIVDQHRHHHPPVWRMNVWHDTQKRSGNYLFEPSHKLMYYPGYIRINSYTDTHVEVTPEDTLVAARRLQQLGLRPAVLNFSDNLSAGGCVDVGSGAQEESLWRRTNLCKTQLQSFYPLLGNNRDVEGIYTPSVTVFKSPETEGYTDLAEPWSVSVVSVPAIQCPLLEKGRMNEEDTALFRKKIELVFQIANRRGHDSLVLGAFGCGAWRGPPQQIAELFRDVLREWNGAFQKVVFACLHTEGRGGGTYRNNYEVFREVLG